MVSDEDQMQLLLSQSLQIRGSHPRHSPLSLALGGVAAAAWAWLPARDTKIPDVSRENTSDSPPAHHKVTLRAAKTDLLAHNGSRDVRGVP